MEESNVQPVNSPVTVCGYLLAFKSLLAFRIVPHGSNKVPAALMHACSSTDCSCQHNSTGKAPYLACLPVLPASMCFPLLGNPDLQRCIPACLSCFPRCAGKHSPA